MTAQDWVDSYVRCRKKLTIAENDISIAWSKPGGDEVLCLAVLKRWIDAREDLESTEDMIRMHYGPARE